MRPVMSPLPGLPPDSGHRGHRARRYPAGPGEYAAAFGEATRHAATAGFVLEQDVEEMVAVATAAYPA